VKTINLQGRAYCQVVERLKYFNENLSDRYYINTKIQLENGAYLCQAKIIERDTQRPVCTGHACKSIKAEFNLEKAETRAIGRALGIFGIGADGSISSYEEVEEATKNETNK